jgi:hypothetical protein
MPLLQGGTDLCLFYGISPKVLKVFRAKVRGSGTMITKRFIVDLTMGHRWMQKELVRMGEISQEEMDKEIINFGWIEGGTDIEPDFIQDFCHINIDKGLVDLVLFDPPFWVKNKGFVVNRPGTGGGGGIGWAYGAFYSEVDMVSSLYQAFKEIERILKPGGICIFKWSNAQKEVFKCLGLITAAGYLRVIKRFDRGSKSGASKHTTTFLWLEKP